MGRPGIAPGARSLTGSIRRGPTREARAVPVEEATFKASDVRVQQPSTLIRMRPPRIPAANSPSGAALTPQQATTCHQQIPRTTAARMSQSCLAAATPRMQTTTPQRRATMAAARSLTSPAVPSRVRATTSQTLPWTTAVACRVWFLAVWTPPPPISIEAPPAPPPACAHTL